MRSAPVVFAAAVMCLALSAARSAQQARDTRAEVALQAAIKIETIDGDLKAAIEQYKRIAALPGASRATVATALLRMGQCYEKLGNAEARTAYERVVREFGDQSRSRRGGTSAAERPHRWERGSHRPHRGGFAPGLGREGLGGRLSPRMGVMPFISSQVRPVDTIIGFATSSPASKSKSTGRLSRPLPIRP